MVRALLLSTVLMTAAPALAQQAAEPAQNATPASPTDTVASIVNTEFPAYDANNDGQLDKAEFSRWMLALKNQEMKSTGQTLPPEKITEWADGAFATADADKSASISKPELISYLSGGAAG